MLSEQSWAAFDPALCVDSTVEIAVQINGKVRARINIPTDADQAEALIIAHENEDVIRAVEGKNIVKEIYVKGRIVNIVCK